MNWERCRCGLLAFALALLIAAVPAFLVYFYRPLTFHEKYERVVTVGASLEDVKAQLGEPNHPDGWNYPPDICLWRDATERQVIGASVGSGTVTRKWFHVWDRASGTRVQNESSNSPPPTVWKTFRDKAC